MKISGPAVLTRRTYPGHSECQLYVYINFTIIQTSLESHQITLVPAKLFDWEDWCWMDCLYLCDLWYVLWVRLVVVTRSEIEGSVVVSTSAPTLHDWEVAAYITVITRYLSSLQNKPTARVRSLKYLERWEEAWAWDAAVERWEIAKERRERRPALAQRGCQNHHKISPDTPAHCTWVTSPCPSPLIEDRWSPPGVQLLWVRASPPPAPLTTTWQGGGGDWPTISLSGHWGRLHCYIKILTAIVRGMDHIEHILHSQGSSGRARQYKQTFHHLQPGPDSQTPGWHPPNNISISSTLQIQSFWNSVACPSPDTSHYHCWL